MKSIPYKQLISILMYLAVATRPNIAYTVRVLARFNTDLSTVHQKAAKYLYRYLQGTKNYKLTYASDLSCT